MKPTLPEGHRFLKKGLRLKAIELFVEFAANLLILFLAATSVIGVIWLIYAFICLHYG